MPPPSTPTMEAPREDLVSPELALVDPDLAARARHRLADPADSTRLVRRDARPSPGDVAAEAVVVSAPAYVPDTVEVDAATAVAATTDVPEAVVVSTPAHVPVTSEVVAASAVVATTNAPEAGVVPADVADAGSPPHLSSSTPDVPEAVVVPVAADVFGAPDAAVRRLDALAAEASEPPPPRRFRRVLAAVALTCAGLALAFLVTESQLGPRETQAADPAASTELPSQGGSETAGSSPGAEPGDGPGPGTSEPSSTTPSSPPTSPAPQRFAWAPVPDASAYHVELYRGPTRVFASDTARPEITIPRAWTFEERTYRLEPDEYRWYVWPVVAGRRSAKAVVQAKLVVGEP